MNPVSNALAPTVIQTLIEKGEFISAHASALQLFVQRPDDYELGVIFLRTAIFIERVDSVIAVLHDLSARIPPQTLHLLSFQAHLCCGHFSAAWQHLQQSGLAKESVAFHDCAFLIALQEHDLPAAMAHLTAIERQVDRPLQHFFKKFDIWKQQGRYADITQQLAMLQANVPPNFRIEHLHLRLWQAGVAHDLRQFERSVSITEQIIADVLATPLVPPLAQLANPAAPTTKPWTRQQQHQVVKDLERLTLMHDLPLFMVAGSLLSLVREGDFFLSDKDMDLGLLDGDFASVLRLLVDSGVFIDVSPSAYFVGFAQLRHRATGFMLDVTHYHERNQHIHAIWAHVSGEVFRETVFAKFALREACFPSLRCRVLIPDPPEPYLASLYGDWRTPDPYFDTVLAARNLSGVTRFLHSLAMIKMADAVVNQQWQKVKAGVTHLRAGGVHSALFTQIDNLNL